MSTAIRDALRSILPELTEHGLPRHMANHGWCSDVADAARGLLYKRHGIMAVVLSDGEQLCVQDKDMHECGWTHEWIWVDGYHYDSEAPFGVRDWRMLPHFRRWSRGLSPFHVQRAMTKNAEQSMLYSTRSFLRSSGLLLATCGSEASETFAKPHAGVFSSTLVSYLCWI